MPGWLTVVDRISVVHAFTIPGNMDVQVYKLYDAREWSSGGICTNRGPGPRVVLHPNQDCRLGSNRTIES
jgi:hypothetical protein